MKKVIVVMAMMMFSVAAMAQNDAVSKFFSKYQNDETFTYANISSKMFSMFTNMEVEKKEDQEVLNAISKLKGLRVLQKEDARNARELYKEALGLIPMKEYEELMSVRDKDKDMKFYVKEISAGKIGELLMIMGGNDEFMVLTLFGEIDLKQVGRMGSKMDIDGLKNLEKIDEKKTPTKTGNEE
jgi:Domain of unknown function (DUF4252)